MERRVMGEEWETAIATKENGKDTLTDISAEQIAYLYACLPPHLHPEVHPTEGRRWLPNGGVLYTDQLHIEYATGEGTARSVVAYSKAGEEILRGAIRRANKSDSPRYPGKTFLLFKNNAAQNGTSYGIHENYLVKKHSFTVPDQNLLWRIGWFLGTRMIFCGNGWVGMSRSGMLFFSLSQRTRFITRGVNSGATQNRAIIETRDEPFTDPEKFRRLHLILSDATIFQAATYLKFATTDLVLDMVEEEYLAEFPFGRFSDGHILDGIRRYARDPWLRHTHDSLTAINRQEYYFEKACRYYESYGNLTPERKRALRLWGEALHAARSKDPAEALSSVAGWAAKIAYLKKDRKRWNYDWTDPERKLAIPVRRGGETTQKNERTVYAHLKLIDYDFDRIEPAGIGRIMEERGLTAEIVSEKEISEACMTAIPGESRAYARGEEIAWGYTKLKEGKIKKIGADWDLVNISLQDGTTFHINHADPFSSQPFPNGRPK